MDCLSLKVFKFCSKKNTEVLSYIPFRILFKQFLAFTAFSQKKKKKASDVPVCASFS